MSTPANDRPTELPDLSLVPVKKAEVELLPGHDNPLAEDGLPMRCWECKGYAGDVEKGVCRGAPPTSVVVGVGQDVLQRQVPIINGFWPTLGGQHWCLAFKRAEGREPVKAPPQPTRPIIIPAHTEMKQ